MVEDQRKGQVPYGYRMIKSKLVPFLKEQAVIGEMSRLRGQGQSYGKITDWLNSNGVQTKMGP